MTTVENFQDFKAAPSWDGESLEITYLGTEPDVVIPAELIRAAGVEEIGIRLSAAELEEANSVTLPKNVRSVWFPMFYAARTLSAIHVDPENPYLKVVDGALYTKDGKMLIKVPALTTGDFVVPEGVEEIEYEAFEGCKVERISLPDTVKELKNAFHGCETLQALTIPASVTEWDFGTVDFSGPLEEFAFLGKVEIEYCRSDRDLPVEMEKWISGESFQHYSEAYLLACLQQNFPKLDKCRKRLLSAAKRGRRMKIAAWLEETTPAGGAGTGAEVRFTFAPLSDTEAELKQCTGGTHADIPARFEGRQVVSIGREAFKGNDDVVRVTIPEGVTKIGRNAFAGCCALEEVTLPESCASIESGAFCECKSLKHVNLPAGLTKLSDKVLSDCLSLESLELPAGLKTIGAEALKGCEALASLTLPDGLESLGKECLHGCAFNHPPFDQGDDALIDFTIPASVTKISSVGYGIFAAYGTKDFGVFTYRLLLHVKKGSAAHKYAMKNKIRFVLE